MTLGQQLDLRDRIRKQARLKQASPGDSNLGQHGPQLAVDEQRHADRAVGIKRLLHEFLDVLVWRCLGIPQAIPALG